MAIHRLCGWHPLCMMWASTSTIAGTTDPEIEFVTWVISKWQGLSRDPAGALWLLKGIKGEHVCHVREVRRLVGKLVRQTPVQNVICLCVAQYSLQSTLEEKQQVQCRKRHCRAIEASAIMFILNISMECILSSIMWRFHYIALHCVTLRYIALQCITVQGEPARGWTWASVTAAVTSPH